MRRTVLIPIPLFLLPSLLALAWVPSARGQDAPAPPAAPRPVLGPRVLGLEEALAAALEQQPRLRQAQAATAAARARVDQARAPLLPQLDGTALYQRTTANFAPRPGLTAGVGGAIPDPSFDTFNYFSFGLTLSQHVYDFGQTLGRYDAAKAGVAAQRYQEEATKEAVALDVMVSYFDARARKTLVTVARETLTNQDRHLARIQAFVEVGARPAIDLAQARTDHANARVRLVTAEAAYETAKARLSQAMGAAGPADFDVADDTLPAVADEDRETEALLPGALERRPETAQLAAEIRAQELQARAILGRWGPSIGVSTGLTEVGTALDDMVWNWNVQVTLTWALFEGLGMQAEEEEALAQLDALHAEAETLRQQVRFELEQARLAVLAARATVEAADEARTNARERLRLAEGRYETGVGNVIELGDAQLALTNAEAQRVQADFDLAAARALLLKALGRL